MSLRRSNNLRAMKGRINFYGLIVVLASIIATIHAYGPTTREISRLKLSPSCIRSRKCPSIRRMFMSSTSDEEKQTNIKVVPSGLQEAAALMKSSLSESLSQSPSSKLLSLDLLTPGLNPKLENKAILMKEYLYDIATAIIPAITAQHKSGKFRTAKFMFSSIGEAAGFQKYCYQMEIQVPSFLEFTDLDGRRISDDDDCIVFVAAR